MNGRFSRQTFLGPTSQVSFEKCRAGVVGLGGGGSHIVQQLAHIGFKDFVLFDPDVVKDVNLNRLVGATEQDAEAQVPKVVVSERVVRSIRQDSAVDGHRTRWQDAPLSLRSCDLIFGCVDGFSERREVETLCRRFLIPLIDIGLDVHAAGDEPPQMAGQVILSMPGEACMSCLGFLSERILAQEAANYGAAGPRPQVIWANGVLASTAAGIAVNLLTAWTQRPGPIFLSYDANAGTVVPHPSLPYLDLSTPCPHFPFEDVGDPRFEKV